MLESTCFPLTIRWYETVDPTDIRNGAAVMDVISLIDKNYTKLSKTQQMVAEYIKKETVIASYSTIEKIARAAGVSTATVVRFTNSLGFSGFADFQTQLQEYLLRQTDKINRHALTNKLVARYEGISTSVEEELNELTKKYISNINNTFKEIPIEDINKVTESILNADRIFVAGSRTNRSSAEYLTFSLSRMFGNAFYIESDPASFPEILSGIRKNDLVIVFCVYHYLINTLRLAEYAKMMGAKVIMIQDANDKKKFDFADITLYGYCRTNIFNNTPASLIYISDIIIGLCSQRAQDRVKETESKIRRYKSEISKEQRFYS